MYETATEDDFKRWLLYPTWTLEQAAALLVGCEPNRLNRVFEDSWQAQKVIYTGFGTTRKTLPNPQALNIGFEDYKEYRLRNHCVLYVPLEIGIHTGKIKCINNKNIAPPAEFISYAKTIAPALLHRNRSKVELPNILLKFIKSVDRINRNKKPIVAGHDVRILQAVRLAIKKIDSPNVRKILEYFETKNPDIFYRYLDTRKNKLSQATMDRKVRRALKTIHSKESI